MKLKLISLVGMALFLNACSSSDGKLAPDGLVREVSCKDGQFYGTEFSAIIGGSIVAQDSWVARKTLMILDKKTNFMCTATLIARDMILTAAHCVDTTQSASDLEAYFSVQPTCGPGTEIRVDKVSVAAFKMHEKYSEGSESLTSRGDIALLRLAWPAPSRHEVVDLKSSNREWTSYDRVLAAGYGRSVGANRQDPNSIKLRAIVRRPLKGEALQTVKNRLRKGLPKAPTPADEEMTLNNLFDLSLSAELLWLDQTDRRGICRGDSGGPAFVIEDGKVKQIGVASIVVQATESETCLLTSAYTNVIPYKAWIKENYTKMTGKDSSFLFKP